MADMPRHLPAHTRPSKTRHVPPSRADAGVIIDLLGRCLLPLMLVTCLAHPAAGGGGPENVFVVVNPKSPESIAVANAFIALRNIPPLNVLMLPWADDRESTSIDRFRAEILLPILRTIESRRLAPQIDCIAYSSDFPWRIDFAAELPPELRGQDKFPSGSLTGLTMLHGAVQSGGPAWLDAESNDYYRPLERDGTPTTTLGFRSWYGWGPQGQLLEMGGNRYMLAVMLGVTSGRGNTVREVINSLRSAAASDGTRPRGTIYYVTNSDVRTRARSPAFPAAVRTLEQLGVKAQIVEGTLPKGRDDVAGLMTGAADFNWPGSGSRIVPGAICENLTSYGAIFTKSAEQTPISEFIRAGAAGSSGTVIEPYSIPAKFPHAAIQVHYARGASLAEAFYQSVHAPYQLLVIGDPLCQPWAVIPEVEVVDAVAGTEVIAAGARLSGRVELEPRASLPVGGVADRFELFIDGIRVAQCSLGERLKFDTATLADGHHDLRVVAIDASPLETQGRRILPVTFANHGRGLTMSVEPRRVPASGSVRISLSGTGIDGTVVFATGRVLGRTTTTEAAIEVPASLLGTGTVTIRATGRAGPAPADSVNAAPVTVEVEGP